jgi:hypothetical protein
VRRRGMSVNQNALSLNVDLFSSMTLLCRYRKAAVLHAFSVP